MCNIFDHPLLQLYYGILNYFHDILLTGFLNLPNFGNTATIYAGLGF